MPDEYGDVTVKDLEDLQNYVVRELQKFSEILKVTGNNTVNHMLAKVTTVDPSVLEHGLHIGDIEVIIPKLRAQVIARYDKPYPGRFEYPKKGSWIKVYQDDEEHFWWSGCVVPFDPAADNKEPNGFTGTTTLLGQYGVSGSLLDKFKTLGSNFRILESSDKFAIIEDLEAEKLQILSKSGAKVDILADSDGIITLGVGEGVSIKIELNDGIASLSLDNGAVSLTDGTAELTMSAGTYELKSASAQVKMTGSKLTLKATDIESDGKWKHTGDFKATGEVTAKCDGASVGLSSHKTTVATAVPGPAVPTPPDPGT